MNQNYFIVIKHFFRELVHEKLAQLLNHFYFQEQKSSTNIAIIIIFFVQKISLLLSPAEIQSLKEQEIYFEVCKQILSWVTFQKPLQMLGSENLNVLLSGFYIAIDVAILLVFCFSLFKWQFISKFFSSYITYFQLLILFQTQIHYISQKYTIIVNIIISIPKYLNFIIIVYCTRNYFIISQQHMLRRYSNYNFLIMITDYITFQLYNVLDNYAQQYLLLLLFTVYFIDSFFYQPFCQQINKLYVLATIGLVNSVLVKICMKNFPISEQIYTFFLLNPLLSVIIVQLSSTNKEILFRSPLSIQLFIYLGEAINSISQLNQEYIRQLDNQKIMPRARVKRQIDFKTFEKVSGTCKNSSINQIIKSLIYLLTTRRHTTLQYFFELLNNRVIFIMFTLSEIILSLQSVPFCIFLIIGKLITQKYYDQIDIYNKAEIKSVQNDHQKLYWAREFQSFYLNNIQKISEVLDEKIQAWNKILFGFNSIDEALNQVVTLNNKVQQLSQKNHSLVNSKKINFDHKQLANNNILTLRYFSFYYSYIENDFITSLKIEKQIEEIMNEEKNKTSTQSINISLLKGDILILGASILQNKGEIIYSESKELSTFFNLDSQVQNINNLMPQFIAQYHNDYIEKFILRGASEYFTNSKVVFGQDGDGYAIPLELSFLHMQQKTDDFILNAVLKKISSSFECIIFSTKGNILGISKKIYQLITGFRSNDQSQQINPKIFDSFVQFWIPNIFQLFEERRKDNVQKNRKEVLSLCIIPEFHKFLQLIKSQSIDRDNNETSDEFVQNISLQKLISPNQINTKQIFLEAYLNETTMPQGEIIYYIEFQSLQNEFFSVMNQEEFIPDNFRLKQNYILNNQQFEYSEKFIQGKRPFDYLQKIQSNKPKEEIKKLKLESHCIHLTSICQELQNDDQNCQTKINFLNYQTYSQSSKESTNSNFQIYEVLKQIQQKKGINKNVIKIFSFTLILYSTLVLFSGLILDIFNSHNQQLSHNIQLIRYPDKFNRLYCSFTTMGQLDLERSLQIYILDDYQIYRIKKLSTDFREQMQEMMSNLRIQFSILDAQGKLSESNIRMMNYFNYHEEKMSLIQFNLLVEAIANDLCQKILSELEYSNEGKIQIIDQYFKLQFLKGNLINQIESSQSLIDDVINEIHSQNFTFLQSLYILLIIQLVLILFHFILTTHLWRESYQVTKQILQLITFPSDQNITNCIEKATQGKQHIRNIKWKYINYFQAYFNNDKLRLSKIDEINFTPQKNSIKQSVRLRIIHTGFQFKVVYLKILFLTFLILGAIIGCYIYLTSISSSSLPEIQLTMDYVQFKQDWDSLMILSFLLKTNTDLTQKALGFGFLDKNLHLKDQNQYFHTVYIELLQRFSQTVFQASKFNVNIFQNIVNSNRMLKSDKQKLFDLYENDLCIVLERELPFCNFSNGKFTYYIDYPSPKTENNNREIFKEGINGIFQKILQIFQQQYHLELLNQQNLNVSETKQFIQSQDFQFYIEQYFFDINKAVVEFYKTILQSIVNILELDFQSIIFFYVFLIITIFIIHLLILTNYLLQLEQMTKASKTALTLLPQECLTETKCLMIIKKIRREI